MQQKQQPIISLIPMLGGTSIFDDWSIWGSIISYGVLFMFAHLNKKTKYAFSKKIKYVQVKSVRKH